MGIRGLYTYIQTHAHDALVWHKLHDCKLVIDGSNLAYEIYFESQGINCAFGGDYDKYAACVEEFFRKLLQCKVKPYVVMDGGNPIQRNKFKVIYSRMNDYLENSLNIHPGNQQHVQIFPILGRSVFVNVIQKLGIDVIQCDFEADDEIAVVAKSLDAYVLSNDSDFYIFDVPFILLNSVNFKQIQKEKFKDGTFIKYIPCYKFNLKKFCEITKVRYELIPLLAPILGNDFFDTKVMKTFYDQLDPLRPSGGNITRRHRIISSVLKWLSGQKESLDRTLQKVINEFPVNEIRPNIKKMKAVTEMYSPSKSLIESWLSPHELSCSLSSVEREDSNYASMSASKVDYLDKRFIPPKVKMELDCSCRHRLETQIISYGDLPEWVVKAFRLHLIPSVAADVLNKAYFFTQPQIESRNKESVYLRFESPLTIMRAILWATYAKSLEIRRQALKNSDTRALAKKSINHLTVNNPETRGFFIKNLEKGRNRGFHFVRSTNHDFLDEDENENEDEDSEVYIVGDESSDESISHEDEERAGMKRYIQNLVKEEDFLAEVLKKSDNEEHEESSSESETSELAIKLKTNCINNISSEEEDSVHEEEIFCEEEDSVHEEEIFYDCEDIGNESTEDISNYLDARKDFENQLEDTNELNDIGDVTNRLNTLSITEGEVENELSYGNKNIDHLSNFKNNENIDEISHIKCMERNGSESKEYEKEDEYCCNYTQEPPGLNEKTLIDKMVEETEGNCLDEMNVNRFKSFVTQGNKSLIKSNFNSVVGASFRREVDKDYEAIPEINPSEGDAMCNVEIVENSSSDSMKTENSEGVTSPSSEGEKVFNVENDENSSNNSLRTENSEGEKVFNVENDENSSSNSMRTENSEGVTSPSSEGEKVFNVENDENSSSNSMRTENSEGDTCPSAKEERVFNGENNENSVKTENSDDDTSSEMEEKLDFPNANNELLKVSEMNCNNEGENKEETSSNDSGGKEKCRSDSSRSEDERVSHNIENEDQAENVEENDGDDEGKILSRKEKAALARKIRKKKKKMKNKQDKKELNLLLYGKNVNKKKKPKPEDKVSNTNEESSSSQRKKELPYNPFTVIPSISWFVRINSGLSAKTIPRELISKYDKFPNLFEVEKMSSEQKEEVFFNVLKSRVIFKEEIPRNLEFVLICIILWGRKFSTEVNKELVLSLVMCIIMFFVIDGKGGRIRSKKNSDVYESYIKKVRSIRLSKATPDPSTMSIASLIQSLTFEECQLANFALYQFHDKDPRTSKLNYSRSLLHSFSEFQATIYYLQFLNSLLFFPYPHVSVESFWSGTFCYNMKKCFEHQIKPCFILFAIFENNLRVINLFVRLYDLLASCLKLQPYEDFMSSISADNKNKFLSSMRKKLHLKSPHQLGIVFKRVKPVKVEVCDDESPAEEVDTLENPTEEDIIALGENRFSTLLIS